MSFTASSGSSLEPPDFNDDEAPVSQNTELLRPIIRRTAQQHIKGSAPSTECSWYYFFFFYKSLIDNTAQVKHDCVLSGVICSLRGFIILLIFSAVSFVIMSALWSSNDGGTHLSRAVKLQLFHEHLTNLKNDFPNQRYELWHRIKIHLTKHLKTAEPTEPVSLIFTAGRSAEKTLSCLALKQAGLDSDEVKLDLDRQLQAAFEGEKPAVVIHHLEELPPSATLIFYRYCDHESCSVQKGSVVVYCAATSRGVASDRSLKEVEELVHDRLLEKLVTSSEAVVNKMDANKFSGLWSRISPLILPVVSEEQTEKNGCKV
uniref:Torsin-1A-interacting protein 1/2 AAA+ activator domain-containing protein n=1 Tax=Salarias fasciatus TaxID=181472 RepID=A0A672I4L3_SALFA